MKCYICHKQFAGGETVFISKDPSDTKIYCENDAPQEHIELGQSAAVDVIAARISNPVKETKEDAPGSETITIEPDVIENGKEDDLKIEFEVTKQVKPVIEFGFDEMKVKLEKWKEKNKDLIVTEQNLKEMKSFKSDIAKERVKITKFKTEINKVLSKPIKDAKEQIDELIQLIKDVEDPIDKGLEVFAEQERQEKKEKVLEFIQDAYTKHGLEKEYQNVEVTDRHLLKSTTQKAIKEDIESKVLEQLEKQNEKQRLENEKAAQLENDKLFIKQQVDQALEVFGVELKETKYLNKLKSGTDVKQVIADIVSDSQEILIAKDKAADDERKRIEKEQHDAELAAQASFEQERQFNQDVDHGVEVPEVIEKDGNKYRGDTGEYVGPSENLFQEQYKNEKEENDHSVDAIRYEDKTPPPKVYKLSFDVTGTYQQLSKLKEFFDANDEIKYEEKGIQEVK